MSEQVGRCAYPPRDRNLIFIIIDIDGFSVFQIDLANKRKYTSEEIQQFAVKNNFLHYMETSVKTNINVEESMKWESRLLQSNDNLG